MSAKRRKEDTTKDVEFKLNEPPKQIPGGPQRESVRVDLKAFPAVERRLRLNRLLLIHDPEVAEESLTQIGEEDLPVLRRIAQEGPLSGNEPALRRNAILMLGRFPTTENLNLLTELARHGEDPYVRGSALSALANTDIALALPVLKEGLAARDPIEYRRAQLGLLHLGVKLGTGRIRELLLQERRKTVVSRLTGIIDELERKEPSRKRWPSLRATSEDES